MTKCCEVKKLSSRYLDRGLAPEIRDLIEQHLHECAGCREDYETLGACDEAVDQALRLRPLASDFALRVKTALPERDAKRAGAPAMRARLALAVAASVLIVAALFVLNGTSAVAKVLHVEGEVRLESTEGSGSRALGVGARVAAGGMVRVMGDGAVALRLSDGSNVRLTGGTSMTFHGSKGSARYLCEMKSGEAEFTVVTQSGEFRVTSPAGHVIVRGTKFVVSVRSKDVMSVWVKSGKVEVWNGLGSCMLRSGQRAVTARGAAPEIELTAAAPGRGSALGAKSKTADFRGIPVSQDGRDRLMQIEEQRLSAQRRGGIRQYRVAHGDAGWVQEIGPCVSAFVIDDFERGVHWKAETWWTDLTSAEIVKRADGHWLKVTYQPGTHRRNFISTPVAADLSGVDRLVMDARNETQQPCRIALVAKTGVKEEYFESQPVSVQPGSSQLTFDLRTAAFKSARTKWNHETSIGAIDAVKSLGIMAYPTVSSVLCFDNLLASTSPDNRPAPPDQALPRTYAAAWTLLKEAFDAAARGDSDTSVKRLVECQQRCERFPKQFPKDILAPNVRFVSTKAAEALAENDRSMENRGLARYRGRHVPTDGSSFREAINKEPFNAARRLELADFLRARNDDAGAASVLAEALELLARQNRRTSEAAALLELIERLHAKHTPTESATDDSVAQTLAKALARTTEACPASDVPFHRTLAGLYLRSGKTEEMVQLYERRLDARPSDLAGVLEMADLCINQDMASFAVDALIEAKSRFPMTPTVFSALGRAYAAADHFEEALAALRTGLLYAHCSDLREDLCKLASEIEENIRRPPDRDTVALLARGQEHRRHGRFEEAVRSFVEAGAATGESGIALAELGRTYLAEGLLDAAQLMFEKAADADDTCVPARAGLVRVHILRGHPKGALAAARSLTTQYPESAIAHVALGDAYRKMAAWPAAAGAYETACALDPESADAHFGRACALEGLGEQDAAQDGWDRFLELESDGLRTFAVRNGCVVIKNRALSLPEWAMLLEWSPDGKKLLFERLDVWPPTDSGLYVANADGSGEVEQIPTPGTTTPWQSAWSPDGRWIAYRAGDRLVVAPMGRDAKPRVLAGPEVDARWPVWSPKGTCLCFCSPRGLYTIDLKADKPSPTLVCTHHMTGWKATVSWFPDAKRLAYRTMGYVFLCDIDGSNPPVHFIRDHREAKQPSVSPTGRLVAYQRDARRQHWTPRGLYVRRVDGEGPEIRLDAEVGVAPAWSPDGRRIVYHRPYCGALVAVLGGKNPSLLRMHFGQPADSIDLEVSSVREGDATLTLVWEAFDLNSMRVAGGSIPPAPVALPGHGKTRLKIELSHAVRSQTRTVKVRALTLDGKILAIAMLDFR